MLFSDFYYLIFLGIVFITYYLVRFKFRMPVLFIASLVFIATFSFKFLTFAIAFSVVNYFIGIILDKTKTGRRKNHIFWFGILLDIGILGTFKYLNFAIENLNELLGLFSNGPEIPYYSLIIPLGISYYTFQALGYLIRIKRGAEKAEKNFIIFSTFLLFFPKFLSGPVERSNTFLPQANKKIEFNPVMISAGFRLFLWGLFKKVVVANNIAGPVTEVYSDVENYSGLPLLFVMFLQTIHLYFDFSGYTDMALGSAKIFGIKLTDNFNRPLFSKSVGELWRRWHISLSSWCNDFIFTPFIIKYRKMGNRAAILGIFVTFFVIGIWHGANWTYVILGILQAIAISYEFYTKRTRLKIASRLPKKMVVALSRIFTFCFFSFSLIYFNSNNLSDAWYFTTHIFSNWELKFSGNQLILDKFDFFTAIIAFVIIFIMEFLSEKGKDLNRYFLNKPRLIRWSGYYAMIAIIYFFSNNQETFVYLQF